MDARHVLDDTNDLIYVRNIAVDEFSRRHLSIGSDLSQPTVCALKAHFFDEVIVSPFFQSMDSGEAVPHRSSMKSGCLRRVPRWFYCTDIYLR